jgi:hypothetical protein
MSKKLRCVWIAASVALFAWAPHAAAQSAEFQIEETTIAAVHRAMLRHELSCVELVQQYLSRIEQHNKVLRAIIHVNPNALEIARKLDKRASSRPVLAALGRLRRASPACSQSATCGPARPSGSRRRSGRERRSWRRCTPIWRTPERSEPVDREPLEGPERPFMKPVRLPLSNGVIRFGCVAVSFHRARGGRISFWRGYWDKLSFLKMHGLPT